MLSTYKIFDVGSNSKRSITHLVYVISMAGTSNSLHVYGVNLVERNAGQSLLKLPRLTSDLVSYSVSETSIFAYFELS